MKKAELKKLIADYKLIKLKIKKSSSEKYLDKLKQIEHKYYHETGRNLKNDLKEIT